MSEEKHVLEQLILTAHRIDTNNPIVIPDKDLDAIPPERRVYKPAAASLIVPSDWESHVHSIRDLPILLGRNKRTKVLEVLGGGLESVEERSIDALLVGAIFPELIDEKTQEATKYGGAFYHFQAISLLTSGCMRQLIYTTKGGETDLMAAFREAVEEGIPEIQILHAFKQKIEVPVVFRPFNANIRRALEPRFPDLYDTSMYWAAQIVQQTAFLSTVPATPPMTPAFNPNLEIEEVCWIPARDVLELGKARAGMDADLSNAMKDEKLRNSIPIHFTKWFIEYLIAKEYEWTW